MKSFLLIILILTIAAYAAIAGEYVSSFQDTTKTKRDYKIKDHIYNENIKDIHIDSLNKHGKKVSKLLLSALYSNSSSKHIKIEDETPEDIIYNAYKGYIIDTIYFIRKGFGSDQKKGLKSFLTKSADALHSNTKRSILKRTLLFNEGDTINPIIMGRSAYLLRSLGYLSDADIIIDEAKQPGHVDVYVITQDRLSLGVSGDIRSYEDSHVSIYDDNFLGYGNRFELMEYFNKTRKDPYRGFGLLYKNNNIFGKFINTTFEGAYGDRDSYKIRVELDREFILPGDFAYGAMYDKRNWLNRYSKIDTTCFVNSQKYWGWVGKSFKISDKNEALYISATSGRERYYSHPPTSKYYNTLFHDNDYMLFSIGSYRENFYKSNYIYGFGTIEDIPYGYKTELTSGYVWSQYNNFAYLKASIAAGRRTNLGYIKGMLRLSTWFMDREIGTKMTLDINLFYMTKLINLRRNYSNRLFIKANYSIGNNMLYGEGSEINFSKNYPIRGLKRKSIYGTTRSWLSLESVTFTPINVVGFKFAFFNYLDMGSLGYSRNLFKNPFYTTIGLGVRIRNESLIFNTIEIRFSALLNKPNNIYGNWYNIATPPKLKLDRFIPERPSISLFE